jgi:hypothetical protein
MGSMDKGRPARAQGAFESSNAATGDREEDETNRAGASAKGGNSWPSAWDIAADSPLLQERRGPMLWGYRKVSAFMSIGIKLLQSQGASRSERSPRVRPSRAGLFLPETIGPGLANIECPRRRAFCPGPCVDSDPVRLRRNGLVTEQQ